MSLTRKGLRKITVQDNNYEWTIRKRSTSGKIYSHKKLVAAVQIETELNRGLLVVDFGVSPPNTPTNPHKTSITPKTIEEVIKKAISEGWDPHQTGTFEMIYPLEFIPDPNKTTEHAKYDTRWDSVTQELGRKEFDNKHEI